MRFRMLRVALVGLALPLAAAGNTCVISTDASTGELLIVYGTVYQADADGGCWRLRGDDGSRYELRRSQAPDGLLREGARVRLELRTRGDLASACQAGTPADIQRVLPLA